MQEYQNRVIEERQELDIKIGKLSDFTLSNKWADVLVDEQNRILKQLTAMVKYLHILDERIKAFSR